MWGWTTPPPLAFQLLDAWYEAGFREVDSATNYPINKNPEDFRKAEKILLDWIDSNSVNDLKVTVKVGSLNNLRTPEHLLTKSFLLMMRDEYAWLFGSNLDTFMIHWDNRDNPGEIRESLEALDLARQRGLRIGLSGIRHPEIYGELNKDFGFDFRIQLKHNVLQSDYGRYEAFHGSRRFVAYGINAGGLKLGNADYSPQSSLLARGGNPETGQAAVEKIRQIFEEANRQKGRPALQEFFQAGMIFAFYQPDFEGILVGASSVEQLRVNLDFYRALGEFDFREVAEKMEAS